jgi:Peptidase_C39 like family
MNGATVFDKLIIKELPEELRDIGTKLINYGFRIRKDAGGIWVVTYPAGDASGYSEVAFYPVDLASGLLRILRAEERARGILFRYEQFDKQWGNKVYGVHKGDTTIAAAGCGPTSLAIVLQYLMNNGSRPRHACFGIRPDQTAKYAETHGRVSGHGTAGDPMIRGIKDNWPDFDGSKVSLQEAIGLLEEGKLIIFLCKGCRGYTRNRDIHRATDVTYGGHYMVLAGVEGSSAADRIFYVVDPGRNAAHAMRLIKQPELTNHTAGFWWVYEKGEPARRVSTAE